MRTQSETSPSKDDSESTVDYWLRNATAGGRMRTRTSVFIKLALWKTVVAFSYSLKRLLDLLGATAALILASPIFVVTAVLILLEDGPPVFFKQQRVGYRGRLFPMWKFRSMVANADALKDKLLAQNEMAGGVLFKMKSDPRVTRMGRFIRKFSIDELPQFWNVLKGDMSLVGPRPPVPREVAEYTPEERLRLFIKPGITCIWQVSGRSNIDFGGQVKLDIEYIRSSSAWTDCKLLLRTIPAILLGQGAY